MIKEMKNHLRKMILMNSNLNDFMQIVVPQINRHLDDYLSNLESYSLLKDAMQYSVDAGGKRFRPLLILAICQSLTHKLTNNDYDVACCLELIHTYSLIHDDLPEMDNDDLRRGRPTNHKVYGQAIAVLAGDGLLTTAFEWLSSLKMDPVKQIKLIYYMASAAGARGMVNGQVGDIEGEKQNYSLKQLQKVHRGKTGALIQYACNAGALLGNATPKQTQLLDKFGRDFGLAFQIYDDILDVIGTEKELGKRVHKDQTENKNTYPVLLGLKEAQKTLLSVIAELKNTLKELTTVNFDPYLLKGFINYFKNIKDIQ